MMKNYEIIYKKSPQFKQVGFKYAAIAYRKSYETKETHLLVYDVHDVILRIPLAFKADFLVLKCG